MRAGAEPHEDSEMDEGQDCLTPWSVTQHAPDNAQASGKGFAVALLILWKLLVCPTDLSLPTDQ